MVKEKKNEMEDKSHTSTGETQYNKRLGKKCPCFFQRESAVDTLLFHEATGEDL